MSLVEIVHHDEVIYSILDTPSPEPPKTPLYESKLERQLKSYRQPKLCRTFGYPETPLKPVDEFLRKGGGVRQPVKKTEHRCCSSAHRPPVPPRPVSTKKQERKKVNFRILNKEQVSATKSKPTEPKCVDTNNGHSEKLRGSGKIPEYGLKPSFGKVPSYLVKRNMRIQRAMEKLRREEERKESLCKLISEEERQKLLHDLKFKWQELQKSFILLPVLTDTIPKIIKKTKMEQELRELEKDIDLIESNPYIYIYD